MKTQGDTAGRAWDWFCPGWVSPPPHKEAGSERAGAASLGGICTVRPPDPGRR